MAKFVKQTSDLAESLNRLQGFAENLISMETNRRIQLGREKEVRMTEAYQYMLNNENAEIAELEAGLDLIEQNLAARGVELKSVKDEYKTIASEELLAAANEGAVELINVKLEDSRSHRDSLQKRKTKAMEIKRNIDLFDDAMTLADPAHYGDPGIIEAEDVAHAGLQWMEANEQEGPEIMQRLQALQTESQLERLQTDYYAKLARESKEKITASTAQTTDSSIKIKMLEDVKKETVEGVKAMTYQPISSLVEQYRPAITLQSEISAGEDALTGQKLNTSEVQVKQGELTKQYNRLGVILVPWAFSQEQAALEAQNLQSAISKAGNGNYQEIINYLKKGHSQYILWSQEGNQMGETYKTDIQDILGIDISSKEWVSQLEELWWSVGQADIEQATEALKAGRQFLPEFEDGSDDEGRKDDLEIFMGGDW
jgi:hypothetical protein